MTYTVSAVSRYFGRIERIFASMDEAMEWARMIVDNGGACTIQPTL